MYDYEYSQAFLDKFLDKSFISTNARILGNLEDFPFENTLVNLWNKKIAFIDGLKISTSNMALASARKIMDGELHKPSSVLLNYGLDAMTLSLRLGTNSTGSLSVLSDMAKLIIYSFRLAESNERAIESTYFSYLIANKKFSVIKDVIVQIGFIVFAFFMIYVF